jgi:hypothetical protein
VGYQGGSLIARDGNRSWLVKNAGILANQKIQTSSSRLPRGNPPSIDESTARGGGCSNLDTLLAGCWVVYDAWPEAELSVCAPQRRSPFVSAEDRDQVPRLVFPDLNRALLAIQLNREFDRARSSRPSSAGSLTNSAGRMVRRWRLESLGLVDLHIS